jgi:predicted AAA+ superfamily ATPase
VTTVDELREAVYYAVVMNNRRPSEYRTRGAADCWQAAATQFPVLLLTGPRQVGKTTLLRHLSAANRRYVTLDDLAARDLARRDPDLFLQKYRPPVLIDEIQYAPEVLTAIKLAVDRDRLPGAFWLTGSQQFAVMKGITETLAGRVAILTLLGFTLRETDGRPAALPPFLPDEAALQARSTTAATLTLHDVYARIWRGSMPALVTGQIRDRDLFYRSYVQTYLERDVRDLTQVGDLNAFGRFLRAVAARTAQMLNYSDLARDCAISVNTARKWMSVLEGSFQVAILPAYHTNLSKRLYVTPKVHFLDTGLCAYLTEWSSPETLEAGAMSGALFETFVFGEILKSWHNQGRHPAFHYYRDKDGREIDLLIAHDGRLWPVEIKKAALVREADTAAFRTLAGRGTQTGHGAVVCLGAERVPLNREVDVIPVGWV